MTSVTKQMNNMNLLKSVVQCQTCIAEISKTVFWIEQKLLINKNLVSWYELGTQVTNLSTLLERIFANLDKFLQQFRKKRAKTTKIFLKNKSVLAYY